MAEKKTDSKMSRRKFMGAAAAVGAFTIVPRHVLGGVKYKAPSEKLNVACVGAGGMGGSNTRAIAKGENIVALCDVDLDRIGKIRGEFPKAKVWQDYRKMLDQQKDIDAVIVATPDHTHAVVSMAAIKNGKHVYVQKPLTHTVKEARMLTEAARAAGVATQMGNQGHSKDTTPMIREWIQDGALGNVTEVHCWTNRPVWRQSIPTPTDKPNVPANMDWDLWLGPAKERSYHPAYHPFHWRGWYDFGCGALGDMGCHILDPAYYSLDLKFPESIRASCSYHVGAWGKEDRYTYETYPMASIVHIKFAARGDMPPVTIHWYDGGMMPERPDDLDPGRSMPSSGSIFVGDKAKLMCGTYGEGARIFPEAKMQEYAKKRSPKTIKRIKTSHELNWAEACKGGDKASSNFEYSGPFTEMVLLSNLAMRVPNETLTWDAKAMKTNNEKANTFVHKEYRKGWSL